VGKAIEVELFDDHKAIIDRGRHSNDRASRLVAFTLMVTLSPGLSYIDLEFQGQPRVIATVVMHGPGGVALVDPGPTSALPALKKGLVRAGIALTDLTAVLLTHIHLDHAGACGTLLDENPRLKVYVHAKGAPHVTNPEKLLASATRLYGDAMQRLWGDVRPVPARALVVLEGGERIEVAGRRLEVEYTPGHASHHVGYFNREAAIGFVGDTAGVKVVPDGEVVPPTPPPDVDLEAWSGSLERIERWGATTLFLTHFGPASPVGNHLSTLRRNLTVASDLVRESLTRDGTDQHREAWFTAECHRALRRSMGEESARLYEAAGRFDLNWRGLARYWRKKSL
jgi:glyoxylase-like metal-dependent hydrolase (beta-lactamase superfamily II)